MNKLILILLATSLFFNNGYSQKKQEVVEKHSKTYLGLGVVATSFQDVKYSDVRYSGTGMRLDFGFEKKKKNMWGFDFAFMHSKEKAKTYNHGEANVINGILTFNYLFPLIKKENNTFYLGAKWDVMDFYLRSVDGLINNSTYYINGSNLKVSGKYERKISSNLKLDAILDLQLISFMKESTSFGFSVPQDALEEGKFSYQNEALGNPIGLKYFSLEAPWNYFNIGIQIKLHYKKRWTFAYHWNMQRSNEVKDYPLTRGYNALSVFYNIQNK